MSSDLAFATATDLAARIRRGDLSPVAVVDHALDEIDARNGDTNAFVTVIDEDARERAHEAERAVEQGEPLGPLHGVPVAIKDLFDFKAGVRNTMGSLVFEDYVPDHTVTYVERLEAAGAIVVGKTNTPEWGHKGTTDNRVVGPTSTPFDRDRNAGGSSGGSAAAVADGLVPIAQGTDGGGSVRIPAAWCGVVGLKATFGRVAQAYRPDAFLSHTPFIHAGPLARTVEDAALMLDVMSGPHSRDPLSVPDDGMALREAVGRGVADLSIGYSADFGGFPVAEEVAEVCADAVDAFTRAGAAVDRVDVGVDTPQEELSAVWIRQFGSMHHSSVDAMAEHGTDLLGDHADELCPAFADMLRDTADLRVVDAKRDDRVRTRVYDAVQDVLDEHDLLVTPTLAVPPVENEPDPSVQTVGPSAVNGEPVDPLIGWCLTYPINFTGHPAASVPAGFTPDGLPVGLQIVGNRFDDEAVVAAGGALERLRPWHDSYPAR